MLYNTIKMMILYFIPGACVREKENIRLKPKYEIPEIWWTAS